jgi:hypothetical protein
MINNNYLIDSDNVFSDSGGYCDFLPIKGCLELGFKSFKRKDKAQQALDYQKKLAKFNLAPIPITDLCKIPYYFDPQILAVWTPKETTTNWGFVTEKASMLEPETIDIDCTKLGHCKYTYRYLPKIQKLVEDIKEKTGLKFWDCHEHNVGYIKRGRKKLFVCIDTGPESFKGYANAWGFEEPGPKCPYCLKYQCKCSE